MAITTSELTSASTEDGLDISKEGVVTGNGVFDDMMEAVTTHLDAQFTSGRITGKDYATVYLGAMQFTIQQSVTFLLGKHKTDAEVAVLQQKGVTEFAQTGTAVKEAPTDTSILGRQSTLFDQQAKGFKWNADQKYLKTIMDAWSVNIGNGGEDISVDAIAAGATTGLAADGVTPLVNSKNVNELIIGAKPVDPDA